MWHPDFGIFFVVHGLPDANGILQDPTFFVDAQENIVVQVKVVPERRNVFFGHFEIGRIGKVFDGFENLGSAFLQI